MTPLVIREVSRSDRAAVLFSFDHLGERSLHQRFMSPARSAALREVDRIVAADHWHSEALIAFARAPRTPP